MLAVNLASEDSGFSSLAASRRDHPQRLGSTLGVVIPSRAHGSVACISGARPIRHLRSGVAILPCVLDPFDRHMLPYGKMEPANLHGGFTRVSQGRLRPGSLRLPRHRSPIRLSYESKLSDVGHLLRGATKPRGLVARAVAQDVEGSPQDEARSRDHGDLAPNA
jgi:hypothetical protein